MHFARKIKISIPHTINFQYINMNKYIGAYDRHFMIEKILLSLKVLNFIFTRHINEMIYYIHTRFWLVSELYDI